MKKTLLLAAGLAVFVAGCKSDGGEETSAGTAGVSTGADATPPPAGASFASVQALFGKKCMPCHGENGQEGIDLRTYDSVMKGGEPGPVVIAGDPENSLIIHALRGLKGKAQMPFKQPPLPEAEIKMVEDWIKAGAKA
ncbi:MAG: c-type cytochrome domain-containing protein [Fimbriimonadaceae bacterium]